MEYTKGEWIADVRVGCVAVYADNKTTRSYHPGMPDPEVCIYYGHGEQILNEDGSFRKWTVSPEQVANAQLIASAPDLYEACKSLVSVVRELEYNKAELNKAKQALAKAKTNKEGMSMYDPNNNNEFEEREREADEDIRLGKVKTSNSVEELIKELNSED